MKISSNIDILNMVVEFHTDEIPSNLAGIILCGSARSKELSKQINDIDYIVIVNNINADLIKKIARIREYLTKNYGIECSNTIGLRTQLENLNNEYLYLDGKLVQALIESNTDNTKTFDLTIPKLDSNKIQAFSEHNYYQIKNTLLKLLVRQPRNLTDDSKTKILKVARIAVKMILQSGVSMDKIQNIDQDINEYLSNITLKTKEEINIVALRAISLL